MTFDNIYNTFETNLKFNVELKNDMEFYLSEYINTNEIKMPIKKLTDILDEFIDFDDSSIENYINNNVSKKCNAYIINVYTIKLLLFIFYGIRSNEKQLSKNAINLILFKFWNERIHEHFGNTFDEEVFKQAFNRATKYKYKTPYNLIDNHLSEQILNKYKNNIINNDINIAEFLGQCWIRIKIRFNQINSNYCKLIEEEEDTTNDNINTQVSKEAIILELEDLKKRLDNLENKTNNSGKEINLNNYYSLQEACDYINSFLKLEDDMHLTPIVLIKYLKMLGILEDSNKPRIKNSRYAVYISTDPFEYNIETNLKIYKETIHFISTEIQK